MPTVSTPARHGFTLIEIMIALAVLLAGLVGMMQMHIIGLTSNNAGRMQTIANEAALELAGALERLAFSDPLLSSTATNGPTTPTSGFGPLLQFDGSIDASVAHDFSSAQVPSVRSDAELGSQYHRYWTVWGFSPTPGGTATVKVVLVSVIWQQPGARAGEVSVYAQLTDPSFVVNQALSSQ